MSSRVNDLRSRWGDISSFLVAAQSATQLQGGRSSRGPSFVASDLGDLPVLPDSRLPKQNGAKQYLGKKGPRSANGPCTERVMMIFSDTASRGVGYCNRTILY